MQKKRSKVADPQLGRVIRDYFAERDLSTTTRRTYRTTFDALEAEFGPKTPLSKLTDRRILRFLEKHWGEAAPATYNSRLATLQSLFTHCVRREWLTKVPSVSLERRRLPRRESQAIPYDELEALWNSPEVELRERLLWRCLYSTAARAAEVLSLNVEDLDLPRKRAVITAKGGHEEVIVWDSTTARLFPRYLGDRQRGPVFLANRQPNVVPADLDRAADGRARLSYQRAWAIFNEATEGCWTLHQLRHSALTHLGEKGVAAPLLMAKSRHRDPRALSRYVQPGVEAVARLTAEHDRGRRSRRS